MICKKYKFIELYDKGSQGEIYLCKKNNKKYLAKVPVKKKEEKISNIMSEKIGAKIYETINCNINKIKGRVMIMEKLEGINLDRFLNEFEDFMEDDDIIVELLINKIEEMHKLGYCHNDLYPSNIYLIIKDNKVKDIKIIDFGKSSKKTKELMKEDYNMLLEFIYDNYPHIIDMIQPLLLKLEENMEKI